MDALAEHEARLTARLLEGLAKIEGVCVYGITDPARAAEKVGVVPLNVKGMNHYLAAAILSAEGERQAAILHAEGRRQAAILEAEGYANALTKIHEVARGVDANTMGLQYLEMMRSLASSEASRRTMRPTIIIFPCIDLILWEVDTSLNITIHIHYLFSNSLQLNR